MYAMSFVLTRTLIKTVSVFHNFALNSARKRADIRNFAEDIDIKPNDWYNNVEPDSNG